MIRSRLYQMSTELGGSATCKTSSASVETCRRQHEHADNNHLCRYVVHAFRALRTCGDRGRAWVPMLGERKTSDEPDTSSQPRPLRTGDLLG